MQTFHDRFGLNEVLVLDSGKSGCSHWQSCAVSQEAKHWSVNFTNVIDLNFVFYFSNLQVSPRLTRSSQCYCEPICWSAESRASYWITQFPDHVKNEAWLCGIARWQKLATELMFMIFHLAWKDWALTILPSMFPFCHIMVTKKLLQ